MTAKGVDHFTAFSLEYGTDLALDELQSMNLVDPTAKRTLEDANLCRQSTNELFHVHFPSV